MDSFLYLWTIALDLMAWIIYWNQLSSMDNTNPGFGIYVIWLDFWYFLSEYLHFKTSLDSRFV